MNRRGNVCMLLAGLAGLAANATHAQSPPLDRSPAFFAGDWVGSGASDTFCFMRLRPDGAGTVLASTASGDWMGASIRWRNDRQSITLLEVKALHADPQQRLMPLSRLSLRFSFSDTIQLHIDKGSPACELQRRASVARRMDEADALLEGIGAAGKSRDRR